MDDMPNETTDTSTKAALTVALLLFASVILGSGALGDDGGLNSAGDEREPTDDVREDDRDEDRINLPLDRVGIACEEGDQQACRELEMMRSDRGDRGEDRPEMDVLDWDRERGPEGMDRDRRDGMGIDPEILVEMVEMWCHDHVYSTFWENTGEVHEGEEGFEIITYDENDNMEGTFISHDAMSQLLMGLEPLVESCTDMMLMRLPMHHDKHEDNWDENEWCEEHSDSADCNWMHDEWDDEEESDEEDDDVPCNTPDCDDGDEDESDESQE